MKGLIVYDSMYGNTEKIALAIGKGLGRPEAILVKRVGEVKPEHFTGLDLLVIGSPTQRFQPTVATSNLLKEIPQNSLQGTRVAVFDTRLTEAWIKKTPVLAFFVRIFGQSAYAAKGMANKLKRLGGELTAPAEGFYVEDTQGPLVAGELERAVEWAKQIKAALPSQ